jgi:hypothetical protein
MKMRPSRPSTHGGANQLKHRGVVYLSPAGKYKRPAWRLSQEQNGLDERLLKASQRPSEPW